MASTYTSNSGVEKPGIGDQSGEWGTTVNTNMDILDRAINGVGVITLSGTTHTLTTTDGALSDGQYKVLVLSGSPSGTNTITISPNDQDKLYFVVNNSGQTATFSQGSGANVSVVNGDTKIIYADGAGSGAAVTEFASEADALEGITAGTVSASKAVIVDANKDITGFRNVTLTGELDAGSLDVSGNADIDGTLEADAMTLDGVAITTTATLSTGISNGNLPVFTTGVADDDFLRVAGTSIEGRSAAEVLSDIGGQASLTFGISNTNAVKIDSASVADDEYARFTASGLESRSTAEVLSDIGASPVAGSSSIVTTGALNSGSITSGFGSIDNGSSAITTTGTVSFGSISDGTITATAFVDEDDMSSDSATLIPTQQSVKAYVDASAGSVGAEQTGITSIKNTSLVVGRDDDNLIKFGTDNQIIFEVSGGDNVIFKASGEIEASSLDISGNADVAGTITGALTGNVTGNVSGSSGSCTGNAATATTATNVSGGSVSATTGTFSGLITGKVSTATTVASSNDTGSISIRGNTSYPAVMSFHRAGAYAINFGLSTANKMELGGWSAGAIKHTWDFAGNYVAVGNITAYSDERVKTNIEKIPNALDKISKLNGYTFDRTDFTPDAETGVMPNTRQTGVIAQEVLKVLPEAVILGDTPEDTMSVAYGNMVGLMVEAIKELEARVKELESK